MSETETLPQYWQPPFFKNCLKNRKCRHGKRTYS